MIPTVLAVLILGKSGKGPTPPSCSNLPTQLFGGEEQEEVCYGIPLAAAFVFESDHHTLQNVGQGFIRNNLHKGVVSLSWSLDFGVVTFLHPR